MRRLRFPWRSHEVASLEGDAAMETGRNLARLALGEVTVEQLGPAYFTSPGTVGVVIDAASFDRLD